MRLFCILLLVASTCIGKDLKIIDVESFITQNSSIERKDLVNYLVRQFDNHSVSQVQLDKLWDNKEAREAFMMARFQIVNQKLYADSFDVSLFKTGHYDTGYHYFLSLLHYLKKFLLEYKVKDVDFIVFMREEIPKDNALSKETLEVPSFLMFQNKDSIYEKDKFLLPDPFFLKASWQETLSNIERANAKYAWSDKINKLFWRGATTGDFYQYNIQNFDKLPRLKAVMLSHLYPNLIDAEFSSFPGLQFLQNKSGKELKEIIDLLSEKTIKKVSEVEHLKYKYLLSIDGNSATGTRVPWIMYSNSVLVKQMSNKVEWFYSSLKPYVHYVPVNERLTNIFSQIEWLKDNDNKIQNISSRAHNFVKNNLMPEHIDSHVAIILNSYSSIQEDKIIKATLPEAGDMLSITNAVAMLIERQKNAIKEWIEK